MATLVLNRKTEDLPEMDNGSAGWLEIVSRNDTKHRPCSVPKKYFDVLLAWGYISGSIGNALITPTGRGRAIELTATREAKKKAAEAARKVEEAKRKSAARKTKKTQ